jgi:hypothetical protein
MPAWTDFCSFQRRFATLSNQIDHDGNCNLPMKLYLTYGGRASRLRRIAASRRYAQGKDAGHVVYA